MIGQTNDIKLSSPEKCTGCAACASICPTNSITMREDREGFLQPHIDTKTCIGCHKCEKTCPPINTLFENEIIPHAFNAQTNDQYALKKSSSGGAFYELSRYVINKGGVVFGVRFDGIHVIHDFTETLDGIEPFMGSKYIQSEIRDTFQKAKSFLDKDRWVLFSGTPCQIAGLKRFLNCKYEKLITVDLICHGVPSPGIWEKYITRLVKKIGAEDIRDIRFRIKDVDESDCQNFYFFFFFLREQKWHTYGETRKKNLFYAYFSRHLFRSSCFYCPYRNIDTSYADITIGDSVSRTQRLKSDLSSTIIVHSKQGELVLDEIKKQWGAFETLPSEYVNSYYDVAKSDELKERKIRPRKLSNRLAMLFPLEYIKWIYMHDKLPVILKKKIKKLCKRNTK